MVFHPSDLFIEYTNTHLDHLKKSREEKKDMMISIGIKYTHLLKCKENTFEDKSNIKHQIEEMDRFLGIATPVEEDEIKLYQKLHGVVKQLDLMNLYEKINEKEKFFPPKIKEVYRDTFLNIEGKKVLITDCEKHTTFLEEIIDMIPERTKIDLQTTSESFYRILRYLKQTNALKRAEITQYREFYQKSGYETGKYDCIVSCPECEIYNLKETYLAEEIKDEIPEYRRTYGTFILHCLKEKINENGVLNIYMPAAFATSTTEINIRKKILELSELHHIYLINSRNERTATSKIYNIELNTRKKTQHFEGSIITFTKEKTPITELNFNNLNTETLKESKTWTIENIIEETTFKNGIKSIKLEEIGRIYKGKHLKTEICEEGYYLLNIGDIKEDGTINYETIPFINTKTNADELQLREGDIIISLKGTILKISRFSEKEGMVIVPSLNFAVFRKTPGYRYSRDFIYYYLTGETGRKTLEKLYRDTRLMNINAEDIKHIEIPDIEEEKQKEIVRKLKKTEEKLKEALKEYQQAKIEFNTEIKKIIK